MADQSQGILSLHSVAFATAKATILAEVSLQISANEIFCLFGRSGSGKTTLLRIVCGLNEPTAGHVAILGVNQKDVPPYRRNIGYVFQDPGALLPHLNVFKNVEFPFKVGRRVPGNQQPSVAVHRALEAVGLTTLMDRMPNTLSGGEKQRVALARALVYEPEILLLDEPFASLDNVSKDHLLQLVSSLRKRSNFACLYVTHDEREALRIADKIGILENGKLQQIASPDSLLKEPLSGNIARLTGAWNLIAVPWDPKLRVIILPEGSTPSNLPLTAKSPQVNKALFLAFDIRSVSLAQSSKSGVNDLVEMPGVVCEVFFQNQVAIVVVRVENSFIKAQLDVTGALPRIDENVRCCVPLVRLKQFSE